MADTKQGRPSLRDFDAYADRNGQNFDQDDPTEVARPEDLKRRLASDPSGEAETVRLASDSPRMDSLGIGPGATDQTAEETPAENIRRISDPSLSDDSGTDEAVERATSSLGQDD